MQLSGCYTALVTPFRDGKVDYDTLTKILQMQIDGGVSGIVPIGTTGESPTLSMDEHDNVIEFVIKYCKGKCQVIAGAGGNSTAEAIHLSRHAAEMGADATLQVTPYYNKPTSEGLYRHFLTVAEETGIPIVLYTVPGRTGKEIPIDVVKRLSRHPLVAAIKEAAGSVERVNAIKDVCDITVLSGDDSLTLPMMSVGATGVISSLAISSAPTRYTNASTSSSTTSSLRAILFLSRPPWRTWASSPRSTGCRFAR